VGEDSARNALKAIEENAGIAWLQKHLYSPFVQFYPQFMK
jgi:hypothetical protein